MTPNRRPPPRRRPTDPGPSAAGPTHPPGTEVRHLTADRFLPDARLPIDVHRWTQPERNPAHDHDFMEIALVLDGQGEHESGAGRQPFAPGDAFVIRPGVWHRYLPAGGDRGGLTLYNCLFDPRHLRRGLSWLYDDPAAGYVLTSGVQPGQSPHALKIVLSDGGRAAERLLDGVAAVLRPRSNPARGDGGASPIVEATARLVLYVCELTRHLSADQRRDIDRAASVHPAVVTAMHLLEEDMRRAWTLADLGRAVHLDPTYLVKLFSRAVGSPPITFLNQVRCERSAALLRRTSMTAGEVAAAVGFADANYFSRRFRAHFGASPIEYRRRAGGSGSTGGADSR